MRRVFGLFSASTALVVALTLIAAASSAGIGLMLGRAVDLLIAHQPLPASWYVGAVGELLSLTLCTALVPVLISRAGQELTAHQRGKLVRHYLSIGPMAVRRAGDGELVHAAMDSVDRQVRYRTAFMGPAIAAVATPVLMLIVIAVSIDYVAALYLLIPTALVPLIVFGFQRLFRASSGEYRRAQGLLTASFLDALRGINMLKLSGGAPWMGRRIAAASERVRRQVMKLLARNQLVLLVIDGSFAVLLLATVALLAWRRLSIGAFTEGQALSLVVISFLMLAPVNYVGSFFYIGMTGRSAEEKIAELQALPVHQSVANPLQVDLRAGALQLENVTASYDGKTPVLHEVNLSFPPGSRTAIIGPSGSGKTTLLRILEGHLQPDSGSIHDGRRGMGAATLKAMSSVLEQQAWLFSGTLAQNLRLAAPKADDQALLDALNRAGLGPWLQPDPQRKLEQNLGESGARLSGGQAQRIALARALVADRPLLLLDEPTSALDVHTEEQVRDTLNRLDRSVTMITVTHRLGLLEDYDRVVVMEHGRVVQSGPMQEVANQPGYLRRALEGFARRTEQLRGAAVKERFDG